MNWAEGYSASYHMTIVDPSTWRDIDTAKIVSGTINKEASSLMESADIVCADNSSAERWVRVWLDAKQGDTSEHIPLFTGLAISPDRQINGLIEQTTIQCYSVLKPAEDVYLERGWYAPGGVSGATLVKQLLSVTPAPIEVEDFAPALTSSVIAENGETRLSMAWKILNAINWRLTISGDGIITVGAKPTESKYTFDSIEMDIVEPEITVSYDWYDCPNVFRAIYDDLVGIARDDSPDSSLSTVSRGREIWAEENNVKLNDNETVGEYAIRRLKEEQSRETVVSYNRRFIPDAVPSDIIGLHLPAQNIDGNYKIRSQSITLGYSARTSEEVSKA